MATAVAEVLKLSLFLPCDGSKLSNMMLCKNKRLTAKLVINRICGTMSGVEKGFIYGAN